MFSKIKDRYRATDSYQKELEDAPRIKNLEKFLKHKNFNKDELLKELNQDFINEETDYSKEKPEETLTAFSNHNQKKDKIQMQYEALLDEYYSLDDSSDEWTIPDEEQIPTFKALKRIQELFKDFQQNALIDSKDGYKEAEITANLLKEELQVLDVETKNEILAYVSQEDNLYLEIQLFNTEGNHKPELDRKWSEFKRNLRNEFLRHQTKKEAKKQSLKTFEEYFPDLSNGKVQALKKLLVQSKGKKAASYIYALIEEGKLPENLTIKHFLDSFFDNYNLSGVTKHLSKDEDGYRLFDDENMLAVSTSEINQILTNKNL